MNNYSIILPIIIAATLGASAMYFMSGNEEENLNDRTNNNGLEMTTIPRQSPSPNYSPLLVNQGLNSNSEDSGSGREAYIGGLTKRNKKKNKHMKKKSRSRRRSKKSKK